jgi:hypothetical protein
MRFVNNLNYDQPNVNMQAGSHKGRIGVVEKQVPRCG